MAVCSRRRKIVRYTAVKVVWSARDLHPSRSRFQARRGTVRAPSTQRGLECPPKTPPRPRCPLFILLSASRNHLSDPSKECRDPLGIPSRHLDHVDLEADLEL